MRNVTRIQDLRTEAAEAGDMEQVTICDLAMTGNADAIAECERVMSDALANEHMTGAELRTLRASLDLSQQSLADRIGVASNTVARWERDENPIPAHVAMAVEHLTCQATR